MTYLLLSALIPTMWADLNFHQLHHFLTLAKAGNITRAAAEIGISQPALSRSLKKLEETTGQPLFERQARGISLTESGDLLLSRAGEIKGLVENTLAELSEANNLSLVRLAVIPTITPYLLPKVLKKFRKKHPEIKIQVREDTTQNIIQQCKDGDIDLAIAALPIQEENLEVQALFEDELILVFPKGHCLEKKQKIQLKDIENFPFISLDKQHCLSDNIAEYCSQKSVSTVTIERTNQLATIQELVALQHGVSMIPAMAREIDKSKQRVYRSFADDKPFRTIVLLQNSKRYKNRFVKVFERFIKEYAE